MSKYFPENMSVDAKSHLVEKPEMPIDATSQGSCQTESSQKDETRIIGLPKMLELEILPEIECLKPSHKAGKSALLEESILNEVCRKNMVEA